VNADLPFEFHPAIVEWFHSKFSEPTEPQRRGWLAIGQGNHTLILAPTGSGKTLAAFLAAINRVLIDLQQSTAPPKGVDILYVSPLKALSYDIERNLSRPLIEIQECAVRGGYTLPEIRIAVRTGDTPSEERRQMRKHPPHILVTTPESLHIILTSSARSILETVRWVIVDEIHAVSSNKRGVFLSLLLERLENICKTSPVRVGLSATQKPLEETALFLGGFDDSDRPRPVEIIDAGVRREIDLRIVLPGEDLRHPGAGSDWKSICEELLDLVRSHKSTIIFANTRRVVERLTMGINELAGDELVKPHHGSISAELRHKTEEALKAGHIRGVVATGTLELGIDMGSVDLVCQVESPKEVSRGLQRVGRAGHAYKGVSKGRIIPRTFPDLVESVAVACGMLEGDVESIRVPKNCLDILAQQIVAMAAMDCTTVEDVFRTVKRAYPFHELTEEAFNRTLQLVSGRYPSDVFRDLKPRVSLDRITQRISPLPGTQRLVIANGGAIPDTGEYPVYLAGTEIKLGELDEEFVFESREGDTFSLGTNHWKIAKIEPDRVLVTFTSSNQARMPFWRGESVSRSLTVGWRMGDILRAIEEHPKNSVEWVQRALPVDTRAAENLCRLVEAQMGTTGALGLPTDKRIVLETFNDEIGCRRLAVLSVFGGRFHHALRIALGALMKRQLGVEPESVSGDNGILFRLPECEIPPLEKFFLTLTPEMALELIVEDLPSTALFGLRFRQNAARSLLLPGGRPGKRTPLWLQRLKAKELLAIARQLDTFPIVVETYRECLSDYLRVDELRDILAKVQSGDIQLSVVSRQIPSPFASSMLFDFQAVYQYEWDEPKATSVSGSNLGERRLIEQLVEGKLARPLNEDAIQELDNRLQGMGDGARARTAEEFYELVRRLGDVPADQACQRVVDAEIVRSLISEGRLILIHLPSVSCPSRLVVDEYLRQYLRLASGDADADEIKDILERHIANRGVVVPSRVALHYGVSEHLVEELVVEMANRGELVEIQPEPETQCRRWINARVLDAVYWRSIAVAKSHARPVSPERYSDFLMHWQHLYPEAKVEGQNGTRIVLKQLEGVTAPFCVWESDVLSRRIKVFKSEYIDKLCMSGEFVWVGQSSDREKPGELTFLTRPTFAALYPLVAEKTEVTSLSEDARKVYECLQKQGALFLVDIVLSTGLEGRAVLRALWELIWSGKVTHDYFEVLRAGKPIETTADVKPSRMRDPRSYYRIRSKVARTFVQPPQPIPGRWTTLSSLLHQELDDEERVEIVARILLEGYGVVAKNLVQRTGEPQIVWSRLYSAYQRMELAGEIQRGYFVEGLSGAQFALPEVVDRLLGLGRRTQTDDLSRQKPTAVLVNACDPAYLFSASGPFDKGFGRLSRIPSNYVVLLNGMPAVTVELASGTLSVRPDLASEELQLALNELVHLVDSPWPIRPYRKVTLRYFGTQPILGSSIEPILREIGFERELHSLTLRSII